MTYTAQIGPDRRLQIPEEVLNDLHLDEGDTVRVLLQDAANEDFVSTESVAGMLIDEDGLLVWASPAPYVPGQDRQVLDALRRERELSAAGIFAETLD